jgi:hypothetical protein
MSLFLLPASGGVGRSADPKAFDQPEKIFLVHAEYLRGGRSVAVSLAKRRRDKISPGCLHRFAIRKAFRTFDRRFSRGNTSR